ncbi:XRE family transcriptional regulator [Alcaligenes faecalis]|uniref:XRE family transcriptional regulator n=1 Tax=Alcaligenes faecalis TaxID=511 RepID=A0ABY7N9W9_ALCFA|nr:XRE family transcriptional regulator [Alcaligenes faecalis]WBM40015.1 XRE family transcriptional regulator [Alcaligenes faecalis]
MEKQVNNRMITIARESREQTQAALSRALGVTQGTLSKIEAGVTPCPDGILHKLSSVLDYPESFFCYDRPIHGIGTGAHHLLYRKRALPAKTLKRIEAQINLKRMHIEELLASTEMESSRTIPRLDPEDFERGVEQIAQAVRMYWNLPSGPIDNVTELLESAGAIIIEHDFGTDKVDATSLRIGDLPPLIFISPTLPGDRLRFTLAHELGHLIMHTIPHPSVEEEADRFAAEFLMPATDIGHHLVRLDLSKAARLKPYWKASLAAIIYRAHSLGRITDNQYRYLFYQLSASGMRKNEPEELAIAKERPTTHSALLDYFKFNLGYSVEDLMKLFRLNARDFSNSYSKRTTASVSHLRVV